MDASIAEIIGSHGASMYGEPAAYIQGPSLGGGFQASLGGGAASNGTAVVLLVAVLGLVWLYVATRGRQA